MAVRYISPTGSGLMDGSSIENAAALTNLSKMIAAAGAGGEVRLLADHGTYHPSGQISLMSGGTLDAPVTIRGVDSAGQPMAADISGTRPENWSAGQSEGSELFRLLSGANNLHFEDLAIRNVGNGAFRIGADIQNLTIEHVDATNVTRFIENNVSGTATSATITGLTVRDVDIDGYSKGAIQLKYNTSNVLIEDVRGDSQGQNGGLYISGVALDGTAHDVTLRGVEMANSHGTGTASQYWNGDGFTTERGVYDVRFEDTISRGNTDAGYDLKSSDTVLIRALAEDNNRSFRLWSDSITLKDSISLNPTHSGGIGGTAHVWLGAGAAATIDNFHFTDGDLINTLFDLSQGGANLTLANTVVPEIYAGLVWLLNGSSIHMVANHAPTAVTVAGGSVAENAAAGTVVATLSAIDPDAADQHVFTLSGPQAGLFDIVGSEIKLHAAATLDFETSAHHDITVTATDQNGLSYSQTVTIGVTDVVEGGNGTAGDDLMIGTRGSDVLRGGAGEDQYIVNATGDVVTELAGQGRDLVITTLSKYTLTANVEDLTFTGNAKFAGTGNALANTINGGDGMDTLHGGDGADRLYGNAGDDLLYGDRQDDRVYGGAGNDKLYGGSGNDQLWGGEGNDTLAGEAGNDTLNGGAGRDLLIGGQEKDTFIFDTAPIPQNADTIQDFSTVFDRIGLDHAVFDTLSLGKLAAGAFAHWQDAGQADDRVIYDHSDGKLYYDPTGGAHDDAMLVATLTNAPAALSADDFFVF